jgi:hypothetical protein
VVWPRAGAPRKGEIHRSSNTSGGVGQRGVAQVAFADILALVELTLLADVERLQGTVIAHHTGPDLARLTLIVGQSDRGEDGLVRGLHCRHDIQVSIGWD